MAIKEKTPPEEQKLEGGQAAAAPEHTGPETAQAAPHDYSRQPRHAPKPCATSRREMTNPSAKKQFFSEKSKKHTSFFPKTFTLSYLFGSTR